MDTVNDSEKNKKAADSAYSTSGSNSQSRWSSKSSKSTHSGSNSSSSSGYGGKPTTSGNGYNLVQSQKKEKEIKKTPIQSETIPDVQTETENIPPENVKEYDTIKEEPTNVEEAPPPEVPPPENVIENLDTPAADQNGPKKEDGFSCVISMDNGVVMYTTSSLTTTLGFPKDMWIGRSFIDFVHPRDRNTFASQITNRLVAPRLLNKTEEKDEFQKNLETTIVCRIRRYRGLKFGFGVKDSIVTYIPFLLKFNLKNISEGVGFLTYLIIQAIPFYSAFKKSNDVPAKTVPFVTRHAANGILKYIDPESVPYLGYLPQDVTDKDILQLYHPDDLSYLRQIYETIVKEGAVSRSEPYRMMIQNGDYIKLVTEWSSFINPWSKKLEFVIGKHHIIEGPKNPDVFQDPDPEKNLKLSEEETAKAKMLRESIVRIMEEELTKPAGLVKQQISKRCQALANFMESLMADPPKIDDEFRPKTKDADQNCNERDSAKIRRTLPHQGHVDTKCSTETVLSYNQLNYNETLQRYFDSQQPLSYEEYNMVTAEIIPGLKTSPPSTSCMSSMAHTSGGSSDVANSCELIGMSMGGTSPDAALQDYQRVCLTEALLSKHNAEMEKELMKHQRVTWSGGKITREKVESKKKKKDHVANCNKFYTPALIQCQGVKRTMNQEEEVGVNKHHCPSPHRSGQKQVTNFDFAQPSSTITHAVANKNLRTSNPVHNMSTCILGVVSPQQMPIVNPVPPMPPMPGMSSIPGVPQTQRMPGCFPMYTPTPTNSAGPSTSYDSTKAATIGRNSQFPASHMQCMTCVSPFMYNPYGQLPDSMQQRIVGKNMLCHTMNPLSLCTNTYEETCKSSNQLRSEKVNSTWHNKKQSDSQATFSKYEQNSADSSSSNNARNRKSDKAPDNNQEHYSKKTDNILSNNEETVDKTDAESSYSSFYSSFFKTESGSAEESGDNKNKEKAPKTRMTGSDDADANCIYKGDTKCDTYYKPDDIKKIPKRKMEPPWMEQVSVTPELIYKYQITPKPMDEILTADRMKILQIQQPSLVNQQLEQLYTDLQLEGVTTRLTLEEGITSTSSSDDESNAKSIKNGRHKRGYSKLVMIYEEDAPMPPPEDGEKLARDTTLS